MKSGYVELHMHSNYSLLEGGSSVDELLTQAKQLGYQSVALTDHNSLSGSMEFAQKSRKIGIKPIIGLELDVIGDPTNSMNSEVTHHVTLLAENQVGYSNLCKLSSAAFGLYELTALSRADKRMNPSVSISTLISHTDGVILLTGCQQGLLNQKLGNGEAKASKDILRYWVNSFGFNNVFIEIQNNFVLGDSNRARRLLKLSFDTGISSVATGNVHYHIPSRYRLQDILVAINHKVRIDEAESVRRPNAEFYLRAPSEQVVRFSQYGKHLTDNSVLISERCQFDLTKDLEYELPTPALPSKLSAHEYLSEMCFQKLEHRYQNTEFLTTAYERLTEELRLIDKHDLSGFFLIYADIFELAKSVATEVRGSNNRYRNRLPIGRGRGSSVASVVCYLIGLSHIDPVQNNLFLGRFLNEELYSLPDIDLDFPRDIRAVLIERIYEYWGIEYAALVATFSRYKLRSAIRDVGQALGLPKNLLRRLIKQSSLVSNIDELSEFIESSVELSPKSKVPNWHLLLELVGQIVGFPRHISQHPGGMVISSKPLTNYVACQPTTWPNRYICQWDKDSIDDARMIKIDLLGLGMLSVVEETVDLIVRDKNPSIDLSRINFDDDAVYDSICAADTIGVFQIESRAQISMLPRTKPRNLNDLAIQVAIVRPGPIVGGAVNPYIQRREKKLLSPDYEPPYAHPDLRPVLAETLGVVIFQEQVIQVAQILADFTAGEADKFRRTLGKKSGLAEINDYREKFLDAALKKGVTSQSAIDIFNNLLGFAQFGFPKSHGTAFALLAYQTAWLKQYYPAEFICALLNNQPMGFYPPHVLTNDAKRHGMVINRPDINFSSISCTVDPRTNDDSDIVNIGIGYVRGIGLTLASQIITERERAGPYITLFQFIQRTALPIEAVLNLIQVGAFDSFGLNRRQLIWHMGLFQGKALSTYIDSNGISNHQLQLSFQEPITDIDFEDFDRFEKMITDYRLLNLSPDSHPMEFFRSMQPNQFMPSYDLASKSPTTSVEVIGLLVCRQRPSTANGVVFLLLEDEFGVINALLRPAIVDKYNLVINTAVFLRITGTLEGNVNQARTIIVDEITPMRFDMPSMSATLNLRTKSWN